VNILITGATGFIGRHLAFCLAKGSHAVRCLVRETSDISCLKNLNVDLFYGDLLSKDSLRVALDRVDLIYHLAGEVYSRKRDDYYKGNILGTQILLEACKEKDPKRIIFLSSVGVYKPVARGNLLTEESECEPITLYGKTKLHAEELIKKQNIPWVVVRAPVVYGPHQPKVLNRFFLDAVNKRKVYTVGKEDNVRSLCYVENLVEGLVSLATKTEVKEETYILSDHSPYPFDEVVRTITKLTGKEIKVVHLPNILGDVSWQINNVMGKLFNLYFVELYALKTMQLHWECDISKAEKEIDYHPRITLKAGVERTIDWIRNNRHG
jgi:nucleoside-diphosphate-sugar epimerase